MCHSLYKILNNQQTTDPENEEYLSLSDSDLETTIRQYNEIMKKNPINDLEEEEEKEDEEEAEYIKEKEQFGFKEDRETQGIY